MPRTPTASRPARSPSSPPSSSGTTTSPEAGPPGTIGAEQLAKLLTITPRRLQQLAAAAIVPKAAKGRYPLVGAVHAYIRHLREENQRGTKAAGRQELSAVKIEEIRQRIAEKDRRLVPIDEAHDAMASVCGLIRAELTGLPARATRDIDLRVTIEKEIDAALARLEQRVREESRALSHGGPDPEADAPDAT